MTKIPPTNAEGYADPTAQAALEAIAQADEALENRASFLIRVLKFIISNAGFELLNRIELKDRKTGREFL